MTEKAIVKQMESSEMVQRLKLMISNGQKLTDVEAMALANFATLEGLDPFAGECYLLKTKEGQITGCMAGIQGLRRKAKESMPVGETYFVSTRIVNPDNADILYQAEAELRDSVSMQQYMKMRTDAEKMLRESGSADPSGKAKEIVGEPPIWHGNGYFYKSESNEYKDKKFNPKDKAEKRAEAMALKKRFNLSIKTGDNGEGDIVEIAEPENVITGEFQNTEQPTLLQSAEPVRTDVPKDGGANQYWNYIRNIAKLDVKAGQEILAKAEGDFIKALDLAKQV